MDIYTRIHTYTHIHTWALRGFFGKIQKLNKHTHIKTHIRTHTYIYTYTDIGLKRIDMIQISIRTWAA
jgi:hypothetical protein